ncbi:uncharacterized protein LOC142976837 [Anticarsia gemmatalis]|uniref:uncharacterized protein LOC142976837 n=1 Tax=Anticarsia gemmatalis TaxID=129554 RepID=UPI003F75A750
MMVSQVSKDLREKMMNTRFNQLMFAGGGVHTSTSLENLPWDKAHEDVSREQLADRIEEEQEPADPEPASSSSYVLASDQSLYSHQVDSWIQSPSIATQNTAIQLSRVPVAQRSTLAPSASLDPTGMWYLMAMILPLFSVSNYNCLNWRCTPSTVLNAAELFLTQLARCCRQTRDHLRRIANDQMTRDVFAALMDIILVTYAIGFLILSLYQAAVFG